MLNTGTREERSESDISPEIQDRFDRLSLIPFHLGKDFDMSLELSSDDTNVTWDSKLGTLKIPTGMLSSENEDVARYHVAQLGSHRRVTRVDAKVKELVEQDPTFGILLSQILHPRAANYACHAVPELREAIEQAQQERLGTAKSRLTWIQEKLGFRPDFIEAAQEYGRAWLREKRGEDLGATSKLSSKCAREVVEDTLQEASEAWNYYPTKNEADSGEHTVQAYSDKSLKIITEKIWPKFKELINKDKKKGAVSKWLNKQAKQGKGTPKEAEKGLGEKQKQELDKKLKKAKESGKPFKLDELNPETVKKLIEEFEKLPKGEQEKLLKEAEEELNKAAEEQKDKEDAEVEKVLNSAEENKDSRTKKPSKSGKSSPYRQAADALLKTNLTEYDLVVAHHYSEIKRLIGAIKTVLRQRQSASVTGFTQGLRLNVQRRIKEVARGIPASESRSWIRHKNSGELDYNFSLLIDLSSSMNGNKIKQAFVGAVVVTEALEQLGLPIEVLGFNSSFYEFKSFLEGVHLGTKEKMGGMKDSTGSCTDLGWAMDEASKRLHDHKGKNQTLIVLTDGEPYPSSDHSGPEYKVSSVLDRIGQRKQKVVAIGLKVPHSTMSKHFGGTPLMADISAAQLPVVFAQTVENAIRGRKNV